MYADLAEVRAADIPKGGSEVTLRVPPVTRLALTLTVSPGVALPDSAGVAKPHYCCLCLARQA